MRVVALDLALTACGWARTLAEPPALGPPWESGVFEPRHRGVRRLQHALDWLVEITAGADLVLIEGYAYNKGYHAHQIGELGGVVRIALHQRRTPFLEIAPKSVKKVATGNGGASKNAMLAEAIRRLGYQGESGDEADALWILQVALQHYELPGAVELPKKHLKKMENIRWPEVGALVG